MSNSMFDKFGVNYRPNEIIFCEAEPGNDFFLIQTGKVRVMKIVKDKEKTMDVFGPGDIFGEMAIIEDAPRTATAIAEEETRALKLNKESFEVLLNSNPQMAIKLLKILSKRIFDAKRRLQILVLRDNEAKVMDTLCMLAEQNGFDPEKDSSEQVTLNTNAEEVANWCGMNVDDCRKVLTYFSNRLDKLVLKSDKITIKNLSDLHRFVANKRKIISQES